MILISGKLEGDPNSKKIGFLGHNTPNLRRQRRRKFGNIEGFKDRMDVFWSLMGKFGQILINVVILD